MELFADFTGHTEGWCWGGGDLTEWKSGVFGRLCGGRRSCETRGHSSSETGLPPHCSAPYLHLTFNS